MKKTITLFTAFISLATFSFAQIGAPAQDFTVTDLDGNTHSLSGILESGKVVVLDASATWCSPCWAFHEAHYLQDLHDQYGPNGTDQIRVIFYEADASTGLDALQGTGGNTQGDWLSGSTYPFVNETNLSLSGANYWPLGFPTINVIDPATGTIQADLYDPWAAGGGLPEFVDVIDEFWGEVSLDELNSIELSVYPNPASTSAKIKLDLDAISDVNVKVFNLIGALVSSDTYNGKAGSNTLTLNTSALENGQYILHVALGDNTSTKINLNILK
tara:strand:- start:8767 stop:9585 length:819 start_codon:yes stop_codon:yes gene_type:complete